MSNNDKKDGGVVGQILVAVIVALLAGGTAPWWWDKLFSRSMSQSPTNHPSPSVSSSSVSVSGSSQPTLNPSPSTLNPSPSTPNPSPSTSSPSPSGARVDQFVGQWINENRATDGITRVEIQKRLNTLFIHMWGKCHPTDCDWGTTTTDVSDSDDGSLFATWSKSFKEETQQISTLPDGRIQVVSHTHFTDSSGRPDYDSTHYFLRE